MQTEEKGIDKLLFWPPLILVAVICGAIVMNPEGGTNAANEVLSFLTGPLGWTYEIFVLGNLVIVLYFIFGKFAVLSFILSFQAGNLRKISTHGT